MLRLQLPTFDSMSFLAGDSEMARRIREYDWNDHPFGPPASWPQSLRSALSICLHSAFPTAIYWGSELRLLYNDAWAPIPGPRHPEALGAAAKEIWSDIWHVIEPQFSQLISTGEGLFFEDQMLPMRRFGAPEETYWNYSFTPIRGEDGAIAGVFNSGHETTRNVLQRRQMSFLLDLGDAFRTASDLKSARHAAISMLGEHLAADRVGFREIAPGSGDELKVSDEWTAPNVPPVGPSVNLSNLGPWAGSQIRTGHVLRLDDVEHDADLGEGRKIFDAMGVAAVIAVPWMENGRTVAVIFLHSRRPRVWTDFEVSTAEKVLERTLTWIERERSAERERIMTREIDHRARNALAVVQAVVRLTFAEDVKSFREKIEDRVGSLARTHALLSEEHWEPIDFGTLLNQELAPYSGGNNVHVKTQGPPVPLRPEQAQTVALLLHELTTNAAKYGALSAAPGSLTVDWSKDSNGVLTFEWVERIGSAHPITPERHPTGFGSTLLNRVVEQLFGGTIVRSFDDAGLKYGISIPLNETARVQKAPPQASDEPASKSMDPGRKRVLIVEDEAIVAMDLEAIVEDLGYDIFGTSSSVPDGLLALERDTPHLAIVDMNLAGLSSRPIADALSARGVPIIFATGYAEVGDLPAELAKAPRLLKPISKAELVHTIAKLAI
jgi:two-component sensor histidine kinase